MQNPSRPVARSTWRWKDWRCGPLRIRSRSVTRQQNQYHTPDTLARRSPSNSLTDDDEELMRASRIPGAPRNLVPNVPCDPSNYLIQKGTLIAKSSTKLRPTITKAYITGMAYRTMYLEILTR